MSTTIFKKILLGEIPCYKIAESDKFLAFLDIFPIQKGHTLVIPKEETNKIFDVSNEYLAEILIFCKPIAKAMESVFPCERVNMITAGFEVPHAHIHIIPSNTVSDLNLSKPKLSFTAEELKAIQNQIVEAL